MNNFSDTLKYVAKNNNLLKSMFYILMSGIWNTVDGILFISELLTGQILNTGLQNGKT